MVTVVVLDRHGSPVNYARVHISWGWTYSSGHTGWDGAVHFDVSPGSGNLIIDGRDYGHHSFDGTTIVHV